MLTSTATSLVYAKEFVTEPLTEKEIQAEIKRSPTPTRRTPTPEYYGQAIKPRRFGEAGKVLPSAHVYSGTSPDNEFVTEPILGSEKAALPKSTPTPRTVRDPNAMKVFSYVPKPGQVAGARASLDTEGPVPVKGVDLETEPLVGGKAETKATTLPGTSGDELVCRADLDRNRVHLDESFTLTLDVAAVDLAGLAVRAPRPDGLDLINTNQSETRIMHQGRMLKMRTYHFVYLPLKTGTLSIPSITVPFRGSTYTSPTFTIDVEGPRSGFAYQRQFSGKRAALPKFMGAAPDDPTLGKTEQEADFYAQLSRPTVYVNQQVNLTVHFRFQTELGTKVGYTPPSLIGFISEELPQTQSEALVSGTRQRTLERIYRTALFPIHAGSLSIGSAQVIITQGGKDKTQLTEALPVEVKALPVDPEGRGEEGNNALVGRYQMSATVDTSRVEAEAPVRVQFILKGEGNLRGAPEPQLPSDTDVQWQLEEQHHATRVENDVVKGEHIFQYLMVPRKPGRLNLAAAKIRYFDPALSSWKTAVAVFPTLVVKPKLKQVTVAAPVAVTSAATVPRARVRELTLRPNHPGERVLQVQHRPWIEQPWFWLAHGLSLLVLGAGWLWTHRRRKSEDTQLASRARRAHGDVLRALRQAQQHIARREVQAFYDSISRATAEYLAAKFGVTASTIVLERLPEFFDQYNVPEIFQAQFKISLTVCEYVRYAAMEFPVQDMRALHRDLSKTVTGFEKFWKQQQTRKKKIAETVMLIGALSLLGSLTVQAGESELYFLRGNTFAQQEKYEAALAEYQKVISLGVHDPDVYYNLGNMYVQLGQTGRAVLAYERGLQLAPRDADLLFNLRQAVTCVENDMSFDDGWTGHNWGWRVYQSVTVPELTRAAMCGFALAWIFLAVALFWTAGRRWLRWGAWGMLGLMLVAALWCGLRYYEPEWRKRAVILAPTAEVRGRPYADADSIFTLTEGVRVKVEREEEEWVEVQVLGNRHGWVSRASVARID